MTPAGSRQAGHIDRALGMTRAAENAARPRTQGEDMSRHDQIARLGAFPNRGLYRVGPVVGADARGDALARLDRNREGRPVGRGVLPALDHHREAELFDALRREGKAHEPAPLLHHEVDGLGRHLLGGHDEIALVLPVFIVHQDDDPALPDILDGVFDGRKRGFRFRSAVEGMNVRHSRAPEVSPASDSPGPFLRPHGGREVFPHIFRSNPPRGSPPPRAPFREASSAPRCGE